MLAHGAWQLGDELFIGPPPGLRVRFEERGLVQVLLATIGCAQLPKESPPEGPDDFIWIEVNAWHHLFTRGTTDPQLLYICASGASEVTVRAVRWLMRLPAPSWAAFGACSGEFGNGELLPSELGYRDWRQFLTRLLRGTSTRHQLKILSADTAFGLTAQELAHRTVRDKRERRVHFENDAGQKLSLPLTPDKATGLEQLLARSPTWPGSSSASIAQRR